MSGICLGYLNKTRQGHRLGFVAFGQSSRDLHEARVVEKAAESSETQPDEYAELGN